MKYYVRIGSQGFAVEVEGERVRLDGAELTAHLAAVAGTPLHHLLLGGESWTLSARPLDVVGRWSLGIAGEQFDVEVVDERARDIQALTGRRSGGPGAGAVKAPMPGLVVRVEVAAGQRVEAGAALVVVEAMKMENDVRAPRAGVVAAVHVTPGQAVDKGAPLVTLANPEPAG